MQRIFEATFEQAPVGMCHVALDGTIIRVNRQFTDICGRPAAELIGRSIDTLVPPDDRTAFQVQLGLLVKGERPSFSFETPAVTGDRIWLRLSLSVLRNEAREPEVLCGVAEDVAREKQRQTVMEIAASMSHFGSFEHDLATNQARWSDEMFRIYGFEPQSFQPNRERLVAAQHPDDLQAILEELRRAENHSMVSPVPVEHRIVRPGGEVRWLASTSATLSGPGGTPERVIGASLDITERKLAGEAVKAGEARLASLIATAMDAIVSTDENQTIIVFNRAAERMFGYTTSEMIGAPISRLIPEPFRRAHAGHMDAFGRSPGEARNMGLRGPVRGLRADATEFPIEASISQTVIAGKKLFTVILRDITERRRAEDALRRSEQQYRELMEQAADAIFVADHDSRFADVNRAACEMLGYSRGELLGLRVIDIVDERDLTDRPLRLDKLESGQAVSTGRVLRRKDGAVVQAELNSRMLPDGRMLAMVRDVTERKIAQDKIAANERHLRQVLDALFGFVGLYTVDGILIDANRAPLELAGLTRDEVIGKPFWDTYWWNYDPRVQAELRDAMARAAAGEIVRYEPTVRMGGGRLIDIDCTFSPLRDTDGAVTGIVGFGVDITEQKRAREVIQDTQRQLAGAQLLAKLGSWEVDLVTNRRQWSDEIYRLFELDPAQVGASHEVFLTVVHPDDRTLVADAYERSLRDRTPYAIEHRLLMPDGRAKYVAGLAHTVYADSGAPLRTLGTLQDISDRKLAELQLGRSLREKETLLREMHHRVKNNLQIISSLLHFQAKKLKDPDDLVVLNDGRDRLRSMILVHEKLYRSNDLVNVDFGDYLRTLVNQLRQSHTGSRTSEIQVDIHAEPVFLPIETALPCGMIVSELTSNSFKHAFADRPTGRLGIEATRTGDCLSLTVEDDGVGIPVTTNIESPASFGLQLIRNLADQLGATVDIDADSGTRFTITVPLHAAPESVE
jgi:PAS domain S-box-containing protein